MMTEFLKVSADITELNHQYGNEHAFMHLRYDADKKKLRALLINLDFKHPKQSQLTLYDRYLLASNGIDHLPYCPTCAKKTKVLGNIEI